MKKLLIATAFLLATTIGAHADGASSAQTSADFSVAVGDSVAKGTAIAAISVATPVLSAAGVATSVAGPMVTGGSKTLCDRTKGCRSLPIAPETIVGTPLPRTAPDAALKARLQAQAT